MGHPNVNINHAGKHVAADNPLPVQASLGDAVISDSNPLPVDPFPSGAERGFSPLVSFTRPENTTAYAAGDVLGIADSGTPANAGSAIHEMANAGPAGGLVFFSELLLQVGLSSVPSGMANFRAHFFNAAPTAILDNAALDLASGDRAKYLGWIDIVTPEDFGSTLVGVGVLNGKTFKLADGQTSFWVLLETRGGYTPASATAYRLQGKTERVA